MQNEHTLKCTQHLAYGQMGLFMIKVQTMDLLCRLDCERLSLLFFPFFSFLTVMEIEHNASHKQGKHMIIKLHPIPSVFFIVHFIPY